VPVPPSDSQLGAAILGWEHVPSWEQARALRPRAAACGGLGSGFDLRGLGMPRT
jgi:hypothetical protein